MPPPVDPRRERRGHVLTLDRGGRDAAGPDARGGGEGGEGRKGESFRTHTSYVMLEHQGKALIPMLDT